MQKLIHIAAPILIFVAGCGDAPSPQVSDSSSPTGSASSRQTIATSAPQEKLSANAIPEDVAYTVINQNVVHNIKRSLDIRLNKKVSEEVLKTIALELKNSDSNSFEKTFIGYYLPDMEVHAGYWATSHFNPDLEIRILGLAKDQKSDWRRKSDDPSREVVGNWIDHRPYVGGRITIFRKNGKLYMERKYKDGSGSEKEMVEKEAPLRRRFEDVAGSTWGDHWMLTSDGNLQIRDDEGWIAAAKKME